jgi:hypothetical protein
MDAEYYHLGGIQLAEGRGFSEPVVWNFLDDHPALPKPSHAYWMPLASIIAAAGQKLLGNSSFWSARVGFMVLFSVIPSLTAILSFQITKNLSGAMVAGFLAIACGFYLPYMVTTDTFALYMVLGLLYFLFLPRISAESTITSIGFGCVIGLMHLSRADGLFWLPLTYVYLYLIFRSEIETIQLFKLIWFVSLGYILIMGPWMYRNFVVFGTPLSPGGDKMLWLKNYDQLFSYPVDQISFQSWWSLGLVEILRSRLWALGINMQRVVAEQGLIFLLPLIISGIWSCRKDLRVKVGFLAWLMLIVVMTLVFPFAGARGGFFHSAAALQPVFWAVVPQGLDNFLKWGSSRRGWNYETSKIVFSVSIVLFAVALSVVVFDQRVIGTDPNGLLWNQQSNHYKEIENVIIEAGASSKDIVLVKNPPGYYVTNRRFAVVIPDGDIETLQAVADLYGARFLILELDHTSGLDDVYQWPTEDRQRISYLSSIRDTRIFKIK